MEEDLKNLKEIFNQKFFRIPDYQRGYSWSEQQLNDFWEDLDLLPPEQYHYTGLLTYQKIKEPKNPDDLRLKQEFGWTPCYIVDGQQRLTTISIFLKCILDKFQEGDLILDNLKEDWEKTFLYKNIAGYDYFLFGYEIDNPSYHFYKNKILGKISSNEESSQETIYTHNLLFAKKYFNRKLSELNPSQLKNIFKKLVTGLKFNTYEVNNEIEVFITFETMNNRGKSLSKLELLKNRLIYLSTKIKGEEEIDKDKLRDEINDCWKTIYHNLGKDKYMVLDDDDFLKNHWIMYFSGYNRKEAGVFSKFLLNKRFTMKSIIEGELTGEDLKNYVKSLSLNVKNYFMLKNPDFENNIKYEESRTYFRKLNRLGFSSFLPLILAILNKDISDKELLEILKLIENFIFTVFKISRNASNLRDATFFKQANDYLEGKTSLEKIKEEIKNIEKENINIDSFKAWILKKFDKEKGYYDWYYELRYFLFEYELELKNKEGLNEDKLKWGDLMKIKKDYVSIEHIFPQSKAKGHSKKIMCNSLGNFIPLSVPRNSKFQDNDFLIKKEEYKKGSLTEREICEYNKWGLEEIKERGLNLLNFMSKRWKVDLGDEQNKLELLGFKSL